MCVIPLLFLFSVISGLFREGLGQGCMVGVNRLQKEIGAWHYVTKSEGLEAVTLRLFTNVLGWTPEEVLIFLAGVRADLKNKNIHAQYN